jgi:prepilin-type N-terminal cleavage/methylation domain-containing protein
MRTTFNLKHAQRIRAQADRQFRGVATVAKVNRRNRGFTLIEGIVATFILAVVIVAMFGSWSACFSQSAQMSETTSSAQICQSELEMAKVFGAANLPLGTYSSSTATGTWTGAYITSTGWTSGATAYFTFTGTQVASSSSTGAYFSLQMTITDSNVLAGTGTTYTLAQTSLRSALVTVKNIQTGAVDFTMATNLVQGGL